MATIKDIAKVAGVSATAVSKTIRGTGNISQKTRERILQIAKDMNYRPNQSARALVNRKSNIIGLIVPNGAVPFCGSIFTGAHQATLKTDYKLMMSAFYNQQAALEGAIQSLLDSGCENIVLHSLEAKENYLIDIAQKIPGLVIIGRLIPSLQNRCVWMDNVYAGRLAAEHLISKGHRKIAYISNCHVALDSNERLLGIQHALKLNGLEIPENRVYAINPSSGEFSEEQAKLVLNTITADPEITAVIAFNDRVAIEIAHLASENNIKIPTDLSLVGFDDSLFSKVSIPRLTSIKYPIEEMASYAVDLSLKLTQKEPYSAPHAHLFMPSIVERDSVANRVF